MPDMVRISTDRTQTGRRLSRLSAPSALRGLPRGAEDKIMTQTIGRRSLLRAGVVGAEGLGFSSLFPAGAKNGSMGRMPTLPGEGTHQHGRATCRDREGQSVMIEGAARL